MIRRLLLMVLAGGLLAAGAALISQAHTLRAEVPTIRKSERQLQPRIAADRQKLGSLSRANQETAAQLRSAKRAVRVLRREQSKVERSAWRLAFIPARDEAYPTAYQEAFPLALGSSDWYIVHAVRHGGYETTTWDAPEGHEYVIADGSITTYSLGGAPSPYLTGPSGTNQGYYNSAGVWVPSPSTDPGLTPGGPTAICADGTYSYSQSASGTCSWHGGVETWLN
jgi:hypothetical protein